MLEKLPGKNLVLERLKDSDSESIYQAVVSSKKEISPWLNWLDSSYNKQSCDDFIRLQKINWESNLEYTYSIKDPSNQIMGMIGLHIFDLQNDVASIGYWMNTEYTGKGLCTEALMLLVENSLIPLNLIRIELVIAISNIASQKVARKAGATYEAEIKNRLRLNGSPISAQIYSFCPSN